MSLEPDPPSAGEPAPPVADTTFRAVIEHISAITYTWAWSEGEYVVVYSSPQIQTILGYSPEEWTADPTAWYAWIHDEDRDAVIEENKRCETSGEAYAMQYRMVRRDGEVIWVEDSWVVVDDRHEGRRVFQGVVFDITERKLAEQEVAFLAHHDKLTGLPNRAFFEETLELAISRARRYQRGVAVLYLDLDNFKLVNDSLGHHAGDRLLQQLAERLRECTREADVVARQGGDEFLLLLTDLDAAARPSAENETSSLAAEMVAQRVAEAMNEPFFIANTGVRVAGSLGISLFPQDGDDSETMLRNADAAMYQAKKLAPGSYMFAAAEGKRPLDKMGLTSRLRQAVEDESWRLHYQPIFDLTDGRMIGVEALIRWQDDEELVSPGEFIPLAEELGLIEEIGDWVVREIAYQQRMWANEGVDLQLSFNVWPRQLWAKDFATHLLATLEDSRVDPNRIVVEVPETTAMADADRARRVLGELREFGLVVAIDDFGTGTSSLSRLKELPADILKIDRAFVAGVDGDRVLQGMVRAMVELARCLDMTPFAEGIETTAELSFVRQAGCLLAQGFHFARPAPADTIRGLVQASRHHVGAFAE
jgi:diguanylate cyclase (GGDEF)-like protein/PAS domain S-box-containing protein